MSQTRHICAVFVGIRLCHYCRPIKRIIHIQWVAVIIKNGTAVALLLYKDSAITLKQREKLMLTLTDNAVKAINRFIAGSETGASGLRIQVSDGGCSGMQYGLKLEPAATTDDVVVESGGVKVFIDPASASSIAGVTVDFVESMEGSGFKFTNPNAKNPCSCGKSFSA
jgi:iron-sulfur cluster assembly accessory protein